MRAATLIVILLLVSPAYAADLTFLEGTVTKIRDGDTIEVGRIPIRLNGVSAPELNEPFGKQSKQFMINLVDGKRVRCELDGKKTHDRFVGICYLEGLDVGSLVIKAGLALDCPRFSGGRYAKDEVEGADLKIKLPGYCR